MDGKASQLRFIHRYEKDEYKQKKCKIFEVTEMLNELLNENTNKYSYIIEDVVKVMKNLIENGRIGDKPDQIYGIDTNSHAILVENKNILTKRKNKNKLRLPA